MTEVLYKPSPWGFEYHNLTTREALGGGAAGPGKTFCLLMDPWQQIIHEENRCRLPSDHPDHLEYGHSEGWALFLRRTMPQLGQVIRDAKRIFNAAFPDDLDWSEQTATFTFPSGYRYQFGHCMETGDWERYWGHQLSWIGFDELVTFEREQYDMISLRLRVKDRHLRKMRKIRSMSNPVVSVKDLAGVKLKDPQWVRKYFVDPAPEGRKIVEKEVKLLDGSRERVGRIYLPARLSDNPDPEFARDYEIELRANNKPHVANALINADWYINAASYFGDVWSPRTHVARPFKIPPHWKMFRSMDWGYKVHGCIHWWAMDDDGNLFCVREQMFKEKHDWEVASMVKQLETVMGLWRKRRSTITGPADTQLWEERGDSSKSKAEVFLSNGVPWTKAVKSPGSRQANAMRVHARLKDIRNGTPGLVIFENCTNLIRTIPLLQEEPGNPDEPMDGGDDHALDSLFYACGFASRGRAGIPSRNLKPEDEDDEPSPLEQGNRGRLGYGLG